MDDGYPIPAGRHRVEDNIRRSRFITTLGHAPERAAAAAFIASIRQEFGDASHHCWAFVAGPPGDTGQIGMSDAGEPSGTAGRPLLNVLLHSGIGELVVVVTRYFGGTKLGTGGLVRAYSQSAQHALTGLPLTRRITRRQVTVTLGYGDLAALERLLATCDGAVLASAYGTTVELTLALPAAVLEHFQQQLAGLSRGRARVQWLDGTFSSVTGVDPADV